MNGYDSVFANANDEELDFDVMFDQEDSLIDTIVGCDEAGDPLTGAEECPVATAEKRSDDESNPDYDKDIDAPDTKDAPKDAEGTVGYDFETSPENKGNVDDNTKPEPEHVEGEDDYQAKDVTDKGVEDTVTGTIDNEKDVMEAFFREAENALNGQDTNPEVNAEERSDDESNPDYDKDIDAPDTKDAPKDSEGTVGYNFEENPEFNGKVDNTTVNAKDVKIDEAEDPLNGQNTNPEVNAKQRACSDCDLDYEGIDADDSKDAPKDAEGTVGYDFEENPEFKNRDFSSTINPKDVKIDEDVDYDIPMDGTAKTVPEPDDAATEPVDNCSSNGCGPTQSISDKCNEEVDFDFTESAKSDGVDQDVEDIEDPDDDLNDAILDDVESKGADPNLEYDISDEDLIDTVLKN